MAGWIGGGGGEEERGEGIRLHIQTDKDLPKRRKKVSSVTFIIFVVTIRDKKHIFGNSNKDNKSAFLFRPRSFSFPSPFPLFEREREKLWYQTPLLMSHDGQIAKKKPEREKVCRRRKNTCTQPDANFITFFDLAKPIEPKLMCPISTATRVNCFFPGTNGCLVG